MLRSYRSPLKVCPFTNLYLWCAGMFMWVVVCLCLLSVFPSTCCVVLNALFGVEVSCFGVKVSCLCVDYRVYCPQEGWNRESVCISEVYPQIVAYCTCQGACKCLKKTLCMESKSGMYGLGQLGTSCICRYARCT